MVVLDFWAAWCPACREEAPTLSKLHEEFQHDNVRMLGLAVDSRSIPHAERLGFHFPQALASATDLETGEQTVVEVLGNSGIDEEELERLRQESAAQLEDRRGSEAHEQLRHGVRGLLAELRRLFSEVEKWLENHPTAMITLEHTRVAAEQAEQVLDRDKRREIAEQVVILEDAKGMLEKLLRETDAVHR